MRWSLQLMPWRGLENSQCLPLPEKVDDEKRSEYLELQKCMVQAHRHEDGLLNSRLHGFGLTTAFLMATTSQFREPKFYFMAALVCLGGMTLAAITHHILSRTALTIEWYLDALGRLDTLLFSESLQLYAGRQRCLGEIQTRGKIRKYPVSAILGAWLPWCVGILWFLILAVLTCLYFVHYTAVFLL